MARTPLPHPTNVELAILRVLWQQGPSPVGTIHRSLKKHRKTTYSTTLKMVQVMFEKGILIRDESIRPHLYRPAMSKEKTQGKLVDDLVQKAFGGVASRMVVRALSNSRIQPDELAEIRELIQKLEQKGEPS
ncbi:MAG: BlaI/MecI/CopY family transcriptional regulator [Pirellulales bacterium]|nr:BlaI/MecI/CopY family transcriptional regulator [Pirellulales bacterium]